MAHTTGFKELKQVVKKGLRLAKSNDYDLYFELAIDCYRNLRLKHVKQGRIISKLSVNSPLKTVSFPEDMVDYIGIAIIDNGKYWYLTKDKDINISTTGTGGNETYDSDIGEGTDILDKYWGGFATQGGTNTEGYFVPDYENKRFQLRNTTATTIWLNYITSGVDLSATTFVPVKYEDVMIAYMAWKSKQWDEGQSLSRLQFYEDQYNKTVEELKKSEGVTLRELWDCLDELAHPLLRR
ncbi:MAG: hypothetical protein WC343_12515 [Bacilli bacterium]|jgi:hypothetical protein